jgi:hypothetical protein
VNHVKLPTAVAAYVAANNAFDLEAIMATFGDDAIVNDHRNEFAGRAAIREWAEREIVGDRVTMEVTGVTTRSTSACLTAVIDGNFDRTGLPDRLELTFYFALAGDRIDQLVIVHNKPLA